MYNSCCTAFLFSLDSFVSYCCTSCFSPFCIFSLPYSSTYNPSSSFSCCLRSRHVSFIVSSSSSVIFFCGSSHIFYDVHTKKVVHNHKKHVETYTHTDRQTHKTVAKRFDGRSRFDKKKGANLTCHFLITHVPNDFSKFHYITRIFLRNGEIIHENV